MTGNQARAQLEHTVTGNTEEVAKTPINEETAFPSHPPTKVFAISFYNRGKWEEEEEEEWAVLLIKILPQAAN